MGGALPAPPTEPPANWLRSAALPALMNRCPNCGRTAITTTDKLFRASRLQCQNCGRQLEVPHILNILLGIGLLAVMVTIFTTDLDMPAQMALAVGVAVILLIIYILLPLQLKQETP